jgi:hypothetical protein
MKKIAVHSTAWFITTFAAVVGIGVIAPVLFGMALSGGAASDRQTQVFGLTVYAVGTDGAGGFEAGFGPGLFVCAALSGLIVGFIAGLSTWRGGRTIRHVTDRVSYT